MIKTKIQTKVLILLSIVSLLPLLFLFLLSTTQFQSEFEDKVLNGFQETSLQISSVVENLVNERLGDMNVLAKNIVILSDETSTDEKRGELLKVQNAYGIYDDITLIDPAGNVVTSTTYNYRGEWLTKKWFIDSLEGRSVSSDAQIILDPYKVVLVFSVPVFDQNNNVKYVLASQIDMKSIWKIVDGLKINSFGQAYLVNNNNRFVSHRNKSLIFEKLEPAIEDCNSGKREYKNKDGITIIEGYSPLLGDVIYNNAGCWQAVVSDHKEEALSTLASFKRYLAAIFGMILIFVFITSKYVSRKVSEPVIQLAEAADDLGKGNFGKRIAVKTGDELEHLAERFNQASEALGKIEKERKELEESKSRFLSIISHELRSPMTTIKGETELLSRGYKGKLNDKQKESLDAVYRNANRLDGIIVDLLDISKIEAARLKLNISKTDITNKVAELIEDMKLQAADRKIKITTKLHSIPSIETDPERVVQVLRNIIGNAIKFSKDKGEIIVTVEPYDHDLLFSVKDLGIGISDENRERVFEPFFQEEQTIYRKYGGTGLGLTIAKGIVESLGGKIWFKSKKGKGTTFYFTLSHKPPRETKPFNFLLTHEKYIENEIRRLLLEYLGPVGELEVSELTRKGMHKRTILDRALELKNKGILDKEKYFLFCKSVEKIFETYSMEEKEDNP